MGKHKNFVHPYLPNSAPEVKEQMLKAIGVGSIEELYKEIPEDLKLKDQLNLPKQMVSEIELKRHVEKILSKNMSCDETLNFLGAGCYQHYVPAVCDEINSRGEFLTAYSGDTYADLGKCQALFEFTSLMGELLDMDVVGIPTYDGGQATATALRMAARITKRREVLLPKTMNPEILSQIKDYCKHVFDVEFIEYDSETGQIDIDDLKQKISNNTAAVFIENPSYLGFIEEQAQDISDIAHNSGALFVVSADPSSLGILAPPSTCGADIACGELQPLGMHMGYGSGLSGYIATRDDPKYIAEYPTHLYGITSTDVPGEYGFGRALMERTGYVGRENAKEYLGTNTGLWAITAGVYLALMGPKGMEALGKNIIQRSNYAAKLLSKIKGVKTPMFKSAIFKEFVVNFDGTGKTVEEINKALLKYGIMGGKDLSRDFPKLGNCALYCVTEIMTKEDIEKLAGALQEIVGL
jgi:glycine dehydrogenase subunit 1